MSTRDQGEKWMRWIGASLVAIPNKNDFNSQSNLSYTRCAAAKRVTSLQSLSPRHCARATQLLSKKCRSGGEQLAAVCQIWPARDLNLQTSNFRDERVSALSGYTNQKYMNTREKAKENAVPQTSFCHRDDTTKPNSLYNSWSLSQSLMPFVSSSSKLPMSNASAAFTSPLGGINGGTYCKQYRNSDVTSPPTVNKMIKG